MNYTAQSRIKYTRINRNPNNEISNYEISKNRYNFIHVYGHILKNKRLFIFDDLFTI
jgi:hypothetical protein